MTGGVSGLTKEVNALDSAVIKLASHVDKAFSKVTKSLNLTGGALKLGQGESGNVMASSLGTVSVGPAMAMAAAAGGGGGAGGFNYLALSGFGGMSPEQRQAAATSGLIYARAAQVTGVAQMAMAPFAMAYGATMDTSGIVQQAGQFFQLGRMSGVGNRAGIERATFSALRGGITGPGSMGNTAAILGAAGFTAGTTNYLGAIGQVRNAAISMGMTNEAAAGALSNLYSGQTAATMYQYGITTMDTSGRMKSAGDIARQINATFASGAPRTAEQINMSFMRGNLGQILQGLNLDPNSQQMIRQALVDLAEGRNPDKISQQDLKRSGNDNPFSSQFRIQTSETGLQIRGERNTLTGLDAAASTVEAFNNTMGGVITSLQTFKAYLDGVSGTNAGKGIKAGAKSFFGGAKKVLGGALMAAGILGEGFTAGASTALVLGGASLIASGGGAPGYGASFGGKPKGGGNPFGASSSAISAAFGAVDKSGIWKSTGGQHLGTDFAVPVGTPIYATKDGWVSSETLDKDYGNAVLIDHPDGYQTVYAHLSKKGVSPGQAVIKGQEVGLSGKSGNTTGPALHYEVRRGKNNPVNPAEFSGAGSPLLSSTGVAGGVAALSFSNDGSSTLPASTAGRMGTKDQQEWAKDFLSRIGAPQSDSNIKALNTWMQAEGKGWSTSLNRATFNPLNTTLDMPGSVSFNSVGVKAYTDYEQGMNATISTLTGKNASGRGYTAIIDALKQDAGVSSVLTAVNNSAWRTGDVGGAGAYSSFSKGGGNPGMGGSFSNSTGTSKNVYITVKFDQANETNAIQFANRIQEILDSKNNHKLAGSS